MRTPLEEMEEKEVRAALSNLLQDLPPRSLIVLERRIFDGATRKVVAEELGMTTSGVARLEKKALGRLRWFSDHLKRLAR